MPGFVYRTSGGLHAVAFALPRRSWSRSASATRLASAPASRGSRKPTRRTKGSAHDRYAVEAMICVFCGSASGRAPTYTAAARELGQLLAKRGIGLVYGGGNVGLMGKLADAVLDAGGRALGVIPQQLVDREIAHGGLTELHVVQNLHQRKARMAELADAFLTLPGGVGTMEELFEVWSWGRLGLHSKPCGLLNVDGYF